MIDRKKMKGAAFGILLLACFLGGCSRGIPAMGDSKNVKGYTYQEALVVLTTEKNQHESLYTDAIWDVKINGTERTFESYLLERIKGFLDDMKIMKLLAEDRKITLTADEKGKMKEAATEYFQGLTAEDLEYMKLKLEDVETMYEDYYLANKLVNEVTKEVDLEVSDSEAKVISIMQIKAESEDMAKEAYEKATAEGADFATVASQYPSNLEVSRMLGRGDASKSFEDAAFGLATGQISQVISDEDGYYVIACVNDYEEAETKTRKEQIYNARKQQAFRQIYDDFKNTVTLTYPDDYWSTLTFTEDQYGQQVDFFTIYKKYSES